MPAKHRQATKHAEGSQVPAWVWLLTGAVVGAFIMFLMRLSDVKDNIGAGEPAPSSQHSDDERAQKPRFDFYDLLKETHVPVSTEPPQKPASGSSEEKLAAQTFLLQVASFKSFEDADRLRAELILLNLDAKTEQAQIREGETWHRVVVGPFSSQSKLAKARSTLLTNRYEALVLKRQPEG